MLPQAWEHDAKYILVCLVRKQENRKKEKEKEGACLDDERQKNCRDGEEGNKKMTSIKERKRNRK